MWPVDKIILTIFGPFKLLPNSIKSCQSRISFSKILNKPLRNCQRLVKFRQIWWHCSECVNFFFFSSRKRKILIFLHREEEKKRSYLVFLKSWSFRCYEFFSVNVFFNIFVTSHTLEIGSLSLSLSLSLFCAPFIRMSISMKIIVVVAVEVATGTIQVIYLGHRTQRKQGSSLRHFLRQQKEWNTEPQDVVHKLSSCANQQQQTQKMGKYKNHWNASDQKKIAKCL